MVSNTVKYWIDLFDPSIEHYKVLKLQVRVDIEVMDMSITGFMSSFGCIFSETQNVAESGNRCVFLINVKTINVRTQIKLRMLNTNFQD